MSQVFLVTGNRHKADELSAFLPEMIQIDIDLPEIQAIDSRDVITKKLFEARKHLQTGSVVVEDTALHLACLGGFPGALVKWLLSSVGCQGIYGLCNGLKNHNAQAKTVLGYLPEGSSAPLFFDGVLDGAICPPRGDHGFGWDSIFRPDGFQETLAEMDELVLASIKMRRKAAEKLAQHVKGRGAW